MHPEPIRESVEHARGRLDRMLPATVVEVAWL